MKLKLVLFSIFCSLLGNTLFVQAQNPLDIQIDSVTVIDDETVRIAWSPTTEAIVDSYIVYRLYPIVPGGPPTPNEVARLNRATTTYDFRDAANPPTDAPLRFFIGTVDTDPNPDRISLIDQNTFIPHQSLCLRSSIDACTKSVSLTWNEYVNAENGWKDGLSAYEIYESIDGGPFMLKTQSATLLAYNTKLLGGTNFRYKVVARGQGNKSSTSNIISLTPAFAGIAPFTYITNVVVGSSNKRAVVSWYTDDTPLDNLTFVVLSSTDDITYTEVKRLNNLPNVPHQQIRRTEIDNLQCERISYYFKIGIESFQPGCPPVMDSSINHGKSILLTAEYVDDYTNNLTWTDYEEWYSDIAKYEVYRVIDNVDTLIATYSGSVTSHQDEIDPTEVILTNDIVVSYYILAYERVDPLDPYNPNPEPAKSNYAYIYKDLKILVPNIFTPNGRNPIFLPRILATQVNSFNMKIFNRWGKMVFETNDEFQGWDGRDKDNSTTCQPGAYVYMLEVKDSRGKMYQKVGSIAILD
jgi:gliding motility-associated-like protein